jgi:hypothetical protein
MKGIFGIRKPRAFWPEAYIILLYAVWAVSYYFFITSKRNSQRFFPFEFIGEDTIFFRWRLTPSAY